MKKVVVLGASAGGLKDYKIILSKINHDTEFCFVLIQHLDPNHKSQLTDLLQSSTKLEVHEIKNGMSIIPGNVYVMPSGVSLGWKNSKFEVKKRPIGKKGYFPLDGFLKELAKDKNLEKVAVILSGSNTDGTKGLVSFKKAHGYTIAQDPSTTEFSAMPQSAIEAGHVDDVLSLSKIAQKINDLSPEHFKASRTKDSMINLFIELEKLTGVDFRQYKSATLYRRIQRRMQFLKIGSPEFYLAHLKKHPSETKRLFEEVTIHVSSFFRDSASFAALERRVFPMIFADKDSKTPIRIWVPGCSTGQEPYTMAMLAYEFIEANNLKVPVQIFATDVSEDSIRQARSGRYNEDIENEVPAKLLRKYFDKTKNGYQVNKLLRNSCVFARQDLTRDSGFSRMDLVSCRNLLIYFNPVFQKKSLDAIHYSLKPEGFLLLGQAESLAAGGKHFDVIDRKNKIFQKPSDKEEQGEKKTVPSKNPKNLKMPVHFLGRTDHEKFLKLAHKFSENNSKRPTTKGTKSAEYKRLLEENKKLHTYFLELIENQSALYEELHATHEEVLASNEELQSKNEEYEATQEELQAANEELRSVNEEIIDRNSDLAKLNEEVIASNVQIREAGDYAQAIVDTVREPVVILDENFNVQTVNESFCSTFQTETKDSIGKPIFMLGNGQWDIPSLRKLLRDILPQKNTFRDFNVEHEFPNVGRRVMTLNARQMYLPHSDRKLILLAMEDNTKVYDSRKRMEDDYFSMETQRNDSRDDVRNLEVEKVLREKFVSTMSHDLRNPLTSAKMSAHLVTKFAGEPQKVIPYVARIVAALDRADGMISDLLDANRITAGEQIKLNLKDTDLSSIVNEIIEDMTTIHGDRFKTIVEENVIAKSNGPAFRRILENLISNAVKYGDPINKITITLENPKTGVALSVNNTGAPIQKSEIPKIFKQFSRDRAVEGGRIKGWGLGLTIVKGLTEAMNGTIKVESNHNDGTTFSLFFKSAKTALSK